MKLYKVGDYYHYEDNNITQDIHPSRIDIFDMKDGRVRISMDSVGRSNVLNVQEHFLIADVLDKDGIPHGTTYEDIISSLNTGLDVNPQNQITPPIDALFIESISSFTLSADTGVSGTTSLVQTFEAAPGHGIVVGNELLLLDASSDRSLQVVAVGVSTDTITIDRPLDHDFTAAATLGSITNSNMAVAGSIASPRIFTLKAESIPYDFTRFLLTMRSATSMDDAKFGGITALTNGVIFRMIGDFQKTIFNFKTNQEIKQFCHDVTYAPKAPSGEYGLSARLSFNGPEKHGAPLRIRGLNVIQWIVQDDLTGLLAFVGSSQGRETQEEE